MSPGGLVVIQGGWTGSTEFGSESFVCAFVYLESLEVEYVQFEEEKEGRKRAVWKVKFIRVSISLFQAPPRYGSSCILAA